MNGIHKLIDVLKLLIALRRNADRPLHRSHAVFRAPWRQLATREPHGRSFQARARFHPPCLQGKKTGGTFFESFRDAGSQFAPIKWFMGSVTFHHAQVGALDFFVGSEAILTFQTFAATTDTGAIPRLTGIDDLVITRPALRGNA